MTDLAAIVARPIDELERLATAATPGPWEVLWPAEQGGMFSVWGKQGTPPDFVDGWAIPHVALGVQSNMAYIAALSPDVVLTLLADRRALLVLLRETRDAGEHLRLAGQAYWEERAADTRLDFEEAAIAWDAVVDPLRSALDTETPALDDAVPFDEADNMCPNCVTPWKCNGPHLAETPA